MSVKYRKVVNNRKNSKTEGKVYGRAVVDGVMDTKEIAGKISKRCTLTEPDIIAVINALETEIGYVLADFLSTGITRSDEEFLTLLALSDFPC